MFIENLYILLCVHIHMHIYDCRLNEMIKAMYADIQLINTD